MGWVLAIIGALAGAAVSGGVTYVSMLAREEIVVRGAVAVERDKGIIACNLRVGEIETAHNKAVSDAVEEARRAAREVAPTPEARAELVALCNRSASCRSRKP